MNWSFSQLHKVGDVGIIDKLCIPLCLQFSSLFAPTDVSKWENWNQGTHGDYISRVHALLDQLIFDGRVQTKLAMLPFLYQSAFVKNSFWWMRDHTKKKVTCSEIKSFKQLKLANYIHCFTRDAVMFIKMKTRLKITVQCNWLDKNAILLLRFSLYNGPGYT